MNTVTRPRRSALYMPATNAKALAKARTLPADVIVIDLEDAVASESKVHAREAAVASVQEGGFGAREVVLRVNGLDTEWGADDCKAAAASGADAILVPKVSTPDDIRSYDAALSAAPATTALWTMIETCQAVLDLPALAATAHDTRLAAWVMGTNDLAKEMGARLTPERTPFLPFLSNAVAAARTGGLVILDGVCNEFRDISVFEAEARQGLEFGFDGKTLIHPAQVDPCNAVFSPSEDELAFARAVIEAFARPENAAKGAIQVEGKMAELLHLEQARHTVAIHEAVTARA